MSANNLLAITITMYILIISTIHDLYFTLTFTEYSKHIQCTYFTSMRHYTHLIDHITQELHIGISTNQNLHIHFYEWNSNDVTIVINWHNYIYSFSSHFKSILDFPIADETYTYFLTNCFCLTDIQLPLLNSTMSLLIHYVILRFILYIPM